MITYTLILVLCIPGGGGLGSCREQKIIRLEHITDYEACEAAYRAFHSVRDHTCIPVVDMRRSK